MRASCCCNPPLIKLPLSECLIYDRISPGDKRAVSKRLVLANVPSFRFSFRGNMRTYPRSGFSFQGSIRTYLRSGFRSGGTSAKTTLLETTLLGSSEYSLLQKELLSTVHYPLTQNCYLQTSFLKEMILPK